MQFTSLPINGVFVVDTSQYNDKRGHFSRAWCQREFSRAGLGIDFVQTSLSFNTKAGTLRGMHFQAHPHEEDKLVRCITGSIADVVIDLRPESATYCQHEQIELSASNRRALLVPRGCAHGFVTLEDDTEILYMISQFYEPSAARGVRWNDPAFGIEWPVEIRVINDRDANYPDYIPE